MRVMSLRRSLALFAAAVVAVACTGNAPPDLSGRSSSPAINAAEVPLLPIAVDTLPQMDVATFQHLMQQLRGTPVVLNVWASWCGPCREELPHLVAAARRYGTRVQFLGIDVKDSPGPAQERIQEFGIPYPSVADPSGAIQTSLQFLGPPDTIFFDARGLARTTISGPIDPAQLQREIRAILPAQPSG
jgi:cytochrome c biogenesis protein CcmG/thiol:disulfide interchange protein DsbE